MTQLAHALPKAWALGPLQPKANRPPRGIPRPTGAHIECGRFHHIRPRYQRDEGDSAGVAGDASTNGKSQQESPGLLDVHRLLLCLFDANPHLTEGARESLAAAAALAKRNADFRGSKIILLCSGGESDELAERNKRAVEALERMGVSEVVVVSGGDDLESGGSSEVAIGEAVDSHNADMVVIPWEQLHHHSIDANLLSEFVACPVLLLP